MTIQAQEILHSFDLLPDGDKREVVAENLRCGLAMSGPPLSDGELVGAGDDLLPARGNRWIMIFRETGGTSMLGQIWYTEGKELLGPWSAVRKIVSHDRYSICNPRHHPLFRPRGRTDHLL